MKFPLKVFAYSVSNSSFQLPGFCLPRMLKNGSEGSDSDSDGSFEAVTPEHYTTESPQQEISSTMEKHRHILQDVDGELEMEDVAPEVEMFSTEKSRTVEQQFPPPTHAVPPVLQPSPQPISPLPPLPPLPPAHPSHPVTSTTSDCHVNGLHKDSHANAQVILSLYLFLFILSGRALILRLIAHFVWWFDSLEWRILLDIFFFMLFSI